MSAELWTCRGPSFPISVLQMMSYLSWNDNWETWHILGETSLHLHAHPHPPVPYGGTVLCEAQHKQVHLVLSAPPYTETETFGAFLELHCKVIKVLQRGNLKEKRKKKLLWKRSRRDLLWKDTMQWKQHTSVEDLKSRHTSIFLSFIKWHRQKTF